LPAREPGSRGKKQPHRWRFKNRQTDDIADADFAFVIRVFAEFDQCRTSV